MQVLSEARWLWYWHVKRKLGLVPYKVAGWMPRWLVYHCTIRLISHATTGKYGSTVVPELGAMEALDRWGHP